MSRFFARQQDYEVEAALYENPDISSTLPPLHFASGNADRLITSPSGYVYPPCAQVPSLSCIGKEQRMLCQPHVHGAVCIPASSLMCAAFVSNVDIPHWLGMLLT